MRVFAGEVAPDVALDDAQVPRLDPGLVGIGGPAKMVARVGGGDLDGGTSVAAVVGRLAGVGVIEAGAQGDPAVAGALRSATQLVGGQPDQREGAADVILEALFVRVALAEIPLFGGDERGGVRVEQGLLAGGGGEGVTIEPGPIRERPR